MKGRQSEVATPSLDLEREAIQWLLELIGADPALPHRLIGSIDQSALSVDHVVDDGDVDALYDRIVTPCRPDDRLLLPCPEKSQ